MAYQVLARKYRPQRFDEVIGQRGVTDTLKHALASGRIAQAFIFAGPRGVGKTTTARILARALNCTHGPTPEPCGVCEACVEIAEGRDIDVLELDAATHTQVDKVREIIIAGLGMAPVRDRYKVFIIDEVHRLSASSFDALLKSIEEPPPHVVFMMATTELEKVPSTIQSRALVFELRTIGFAAIMDRLRRIAEAEGLVVEEAALAALARAAAGSLRDALTALDQVVAFARGPVRVADVAAVLGLVGRDLLFEIAETVAREDAAKVFELVGRAVQAGDDLRLVCRELARLVRDLLVVKVDPARLDDPEIAGEAERERLAALAERFSPEDLLRAFDVVSRAEFEVRTSAEPRYHLEMALLRWIHLRKLTPLSELIERLEAGEGARGGSGRNELSAAARGAAGPPASPPRPGVGPGAAAPNRRAPDAPAGSNDRRASAAVRPAGPEPRAAAPGAADPTRGRSSAPGDDRLAQVLVEEIRKAKKVFAQMVVAQAQRVEVSGDRVVFAFTPAQKALGAQLEQSRAWLEPLVSRVAGRRLSVVAVEEAGPAEAGAPADGPAVAPAEPEAPRTPSATAAETALRERALANPGVQAMLEVFAAEITKVEEL
jgi:DNA polymerase-3 subunit gamma/tau